MAHSTELEPQKRKRDAHDAGAQTRRAQYARPALQEGASDFIHYLPGSNHSPLSLLQGDGDTFSDIIGLIGEYESVLDRHESLAINLGAKLTGPRILRGIEKFFDGPIKTSQIQPFATPIGWLDVVSHARLNPKEYTLVQKADGTRWCQFDINNTQVEITEDDWRLVWSGALDRFPLDEPLEEDEFAELATLDILEQRASILYKKADEVAARARILNHRLGQRKQEIRRRYDLHDSSFSRVQLANQTQRGAAFGASYDLHADLLQQFVAASSSTLASRSASGAGLSLGSSSLQSPSHLPAHGPGSSGRCSLGNSTEPAVDSRVEAFRSLITQKLEQLCKGGELSPPCDRCRRLKIQCIKHLTACMGCTKKHAKCSWKSVTEDEIEKLKQDTGVKANSYGNDECEIGSDVSESRTTQASQLDDRRGSIRKSGEKSPTTTLAILKGGVSPPSSRDGGLLTTLEPPVSILMNKFDLNVERHRLSLVTTPVVSDDIADRSPGVLQSGPNNSFRMVTTNGPPSNDGSATASPKTS